MKTRERRLAISAVTVLGLILAAAMFRRLVLDPVRQLDRLISDVSLKVEQLKQENSLASSYQKRLAEAGMRTLADEEATASELARARLVQMIQASGLAMERLTLQPMRGARVVDCYQELGWTVAVRGRLESIVNLLYQAQSDPLLARQENLSIAPVPRSDQMRAQFKYVTLVLLHPRGVKPKPRVDQILPALPDLQASARKPYEIIVQRDLFRPYIKAEPTPVASTPTYTPSWTPSVYDADPDSRRRVVGLPQWGDRVEIVLKDDSLGQTRFLAIGDELAGGRIAMVDYRPRPLPDRPEILSGSRVILLDSSGAYWAVELGQSLSSRRRLENADLPPALRAASSAGETRNTEATP